MRLTRTELYLDNLKQLIPRDSRVYMTREQAYEKLKEYSGQDFGNDIQAWETWCADENKRIDELAKRRKGEPKGSSLRK